jgi:hypothetical protein
MNTVVVSKKALIAEKFLDCANLVAVGLVVAQAFNEEYNGQLALIGLVMFTSIYLTVILIKIE